MKHTVAKWVRFIWNLHQDVTSKADATHRSHPVEACISTKAQQSPPSAFYK